MTTYWIDIKACPVCHTEFTAWSVGSCNTFGAKFYTDGFVDGPMYDEGAALLACPGCQRYFWTDDVPTRESIEDSEYFMNSAKQALPNAVDVRGARFKDVLRDAPWKTESQERYVRLRAWWASNDVYRGDKNQEFRLEPEQTANLERLLQLLDSSDPEDSLTIAELLRELGRFDECLRELDRLFDDSLLLAANTIRQLALRGERRVEILT